MMCTGDPKVIKVRLHPRGGGDGNPEIGGEDTRVRDFSRHGKEGPVDD